MKFLCQQCSAKYRIEDEKVQGRTLKMKCRNCGTEIVIREGMPNSMPTGAMPTMAPPPGTAAGTAAGTAPAAASPSEKIPAVQIPKPAAVPDIGMSKPRSPLAKPTMHVGNAAVPMTQPGPQAQKPAALAAPQQQNPVAAPRASQPMPQPVPAASPAITSNPPIQSVPPPSGWHAGIAGAAVGPMSENELVSKIAVGAIHRDTLVWREGFTDWKPLRAVTELQGLLESAGALLEARIRRSVAPPPSGPSQISLPPLNVPLSGPVNGSVPRMSMATPLQQQNVPTLSNTPVPPPRTEASSMPEPFIGNLISIPAPPENTSVMNWPVPTADKPASIQPIVIPGPPPASPKGNVFSKLPAGALITMVGAGVFGIAFAFFAAQKLMTKAPAERIAPAPAPAAKVEPTKKVEPAQKPAAPPATPPIQTATVDINAKAPTPAEATSSTGSSKSSSRKSSKDKDTSASAKAATPPPATGANLTAAQRELIQRMGGDLNSGPGNVKQTFEDESKKNKGEGLSASQLRTVVNKNRPALQRCYEAAIRGTSQAESVRLDVDLTVGSSGIATKVNVRGNDFGHMRDCLTAAVKRWRFPPSGDITETSFPVVFQPGG